MHPAPANELVLVSENIVNLFYLTHFNLACSIILLLDFEFGALARLWIYGQVATVSTVDHVCSTLFLVLQCLHDKLCLVSLSSIISSHITSYGHFSTLSSLVHCSSVVIPECQKPQWLAIPMMSSVKVWLYFVLNMNWFGIVTSLESGYLFTYCSLLLISPLRINTLPPLQPQACYISRLYMFNLPMGG